MNPNQTVVQEKKYENCKKCGAEVDVTSTKCPNCNAAFPYLGEIPKPSTITQEQYVLPNHFPAMYRLEEKQMLIEFVKNEMKKADFSISTTQLPSALLKRKKVFNTILTLLIMIFMFLIFFHMDLNVYLVGIVVIAIFFFSTRKYDVVDYIVKEIKSRPQERISNIVMNIKTSIVEDDSKKSFLIGIAISIILPVIFFIQPRVFYEEIDGGYSVRFYTYGILNMTKAEIPSTHRSKPVVSIRGNVFKNMPLLKEIILPDTITEIRGNAFANNQSLEKIKLPSKLVYLGGGAFSNCTSLKSIELPDTLEYLGGEAFINNTSLETVKLSNKLTEIRGNTFENCESLKSITIPDSVTRIGGHAFRSNSSLEEVIISENSQLEEIGSSAFRDCYRLDEVTLPSGVSVNERAFKGSGTTIKYYNNYQ